MKDFTIKVTFDTTAEDSLVRFDTFEEAVVKLIREQKMIQLLFLFKIRCLYLSLKQ